MDVAPLPDCEDARLAALAQYELGGAEADPAFLHLVRLASRLFGVPSSYVSLIERERQVFFAKVGVEACETGRDASFCAHTVSMDDMLVVLDASLDPRFHDSPLVTGEPHIRFYAGMPLRTPSGFVLGSLCVTDVAPRGAFTPDDARNLADLADLVVDLLEMRRRDVARRISQSRFTSIAATSPDGIICADREGRVTVWNEAAVRLFGYSADEVAGRTLDLIVPEQVRGAGMTGLRWLTAVGARRLAGRTVDFPARHRDGTEFPIELSMSTWSEEGEVAFGFIARDVRERRANEDRLHRLAHHDPLTGLSNRTVLSARIGEEIAAGSPIAVLIVDLDGFKEVNDTVGHSAGDRLLQLTAARLLACARSGDTVARLGGDEFALVLTGVVDRAQADAVADRIVRAIADPFAIDDQTFTLGASVGIAISGVDADTVDDLLSCADLALYQAKAEGRNRHRSFTRDLKRTALDRRAGREDLRRAVERHEFFLVYQPQVRLSDGGLTGAEALLRWRHPERGVLPPAEFIGMLEASRYAAEVGGWVLGEACRQAALWRRTAPEFRMAVNLFGAQCRTGDLVSKVLTALASSGLPASGLELEITETIVLNHDDQQLGAFQALQDAGVGLAFDDYGTGYASLSQLRMFPITRLKIDRSFVRGVCHDRRDAAIVGAIVDLSRNFDLELTVEGVETEAQRRFLIHRGCGEAQGYLFAKPLSPSELEAQYAVGVATGAEARVA